MLAFFTFLAPGVLFIGLALVVYLFIRALESRKQRAPGVVSPEAARKYPALIFLVRIGEAIILVPIALVVVLLFVGFIIDINPFRKPTLYSEPVCFTFLAIILAVVAAAIMRLFHAPVRPDSNVVRKLKFVTTRNISNFAIVFAAIAAHDFYRLASVEPHVSSVIPDRDFWPAVFLGVWFGVKTLLCYLLGFYSTQSSETFSGGPDIPEYQLKGPRAFL